ncbi:hypothetical protein BpHYR1_016838, partial [Brachionus plicatilis]
STHFLGCELERRFKDVANQTLAYYQSKYLSQMLEIKIIFCFIDFVKLDELIKKFLKKFQNFFFLDILVFAIFTISYKQKVISIKTETDENFMIDLFTN